MIGGSLIGIGVVGFYIATFPGYYGFLLAFGVLAILGEVTPKMAEAVGGCRAKKFLVPMNSCGVVVAGVQELSLSAHVRQAVDRAVEFLEGAS